MNRRTQIVLSLIVASVLSGCTMGPAYKRPTVAVPQTYRGAEVQSGDQPSFADAKWWQVFDDPELQKLIRTALTDNFDVKIAAARILEAHSQLGITRSQQYPTLNGGATAADLRIPQGFGSATNSSSNSNSSSVTSGALDLSLAWELDFWGKYRRSTEAARAQLLASQWARQEVLRALVSNVASAYFQLRELDLELEISKRTLASRQDSLKLNQILADGGSTSILDVRQAEQLVYTASQQIPDLERQIQQQENYISTLVGKNPDGVPRGKKLVEQTHLPDVPSGLTSDLLERRPDIRQAEEQLVAYNANIGMAKAAYFPQISLTSYAGFSSTALTSLLNGSSSWWYGLGSVSQPIFTAGKLRNNVRLSEAQKQEAVVSYQKAIQQAFRDVSDQLVAYRKDREFREQQELLTRSAQDAANLSEVRYRGGATSYLEVLTNQTNAFSAELNLAKAQLNERVAYVKLYQALGGGWQQ
jgi:multidrug efflux system outer membrane protein